MTRFISAPPTQFFPQQQQAPRPRNQFNIGGGSGNEDAITLALLQFLSNQQQAQSTQDLREKQFELQKDVAGEQIKGSEEERRLLRRERILAATNRKIDRGMTGSFEQQQREFSKSSMAQFKKGTRVLDTDFARSTANIRRDFLRGEPGSIDRTVEHLRRLREQVEQRVGREENPLIRSGIAFQYTELLQSLESAATAKGNQKVLQAVDEIVFSSQDFIRFGQSRDELITQGLNERATSFKNFQDGIVDQVQGEFAQFDDPNSEVTDARLRQRVNDIIDSSTFTPLGVKDIRFSGVPQRPFRPVENIPGQPNILERGARFIGGGLQSVSETFLGTDPIQLGGAPAGPLPGAPAGPLQARPNRPTFSTAPFGQISANQGLQAQEQAQIAALLGQAPSAAPANILEAALAGPGGLGGGFSLPSEISPLRFQPDREPTPGVGILQNPDGTTSSESTIGVSVRELNNGRETLIPTIVGGRRLSQDEAIRSAIQSGLTFPSFDSVEEANRFAQQRSARGGAATQGFLGGSPPVNPFGAPTIPGFRGFGGF